MDDADRAQAEEEHWLEQAIRAARGLPAQRTSCSHCSDYGELLEPHRIYYGVCVECATLDEARNREYGR